jgi:hypothetical protein
VYIALKDQLKNNFRSWWAHHAAFSLELFGWPASLPSPRQIYNGHASKVRISSRFRQETTMTPQWIAERLYMGIKHLADP